MGPWLCSHGNEQLGELPERLRQFVLQWGRGCVATEIFPRPRNGRGKRPLQWGRGCVATEMNPQCVDSGVFPVASMGPWLCSHGNRTYDVFKHYRLVLQWGRGCVATEIGVRRVVVRRGKVASMGPWLCSHGNPRHRAIR